jgi:hypothetical protein
MGSKSSAIPEGIVAELDKLGFSYREEPQYDLARLKGRVQVRSEKNLAPSAEVKKYAEAMHYSAFPPIIITEDDLTVDGNTRVGSYNENKIPTAWAIIVNARGEDRNKVVQARLHSLAVGINNLNGRAHSDEENREAARVAAEAGWMVEQIAQTIKVTVKTASEIVREVAAQERLKTLGVEMNGGLTKKQLQVLGSAKVIVINNDPYVRLAELARAANLGVTEIRSLAKDVTCAGSDAAALALLAERETEMKERIAEVRLTGTTHPKPPTELRRFLGNVLKYEDNPGALVEYVPENKAKHLDFVERSIRVLQAVAEKQAEIA